MRDVFLFLSHLATLQPLLRVRARWDCLERFTGSPPATLVALQARHIDTPCFVSCGALQRRLFHLRMRTRAFSVRLTDSLCPPIGSCFTYIRYLQWNIAFSYLRLKVGITSHRLTFLDSSLFPLDPNVFRLWEEEPGDNRRSCKPHTRRFEPCNLCGEHVSEFLVPGGTSLPLEESSSCRCLNSPGKETFDESDYI